MELFSPGHLVVLLIAVALLFFCGKQLPDMARSAGRSLRIFRTEVKGMSEEMGRMKDDVSASATAPTAVTGQSTPPAPIQ